MFILKLISNLTVFMVVSILFMFVTASYLPRLSGANYYDHGCFDGVTNIIMAMSDTKGWPESLKSFEDEARKKCDNSTQILRDKGYFFK